MSTDALFDDAAERAVLGAILVRNAALDEVLDALDAAQFRRAAHAGIYRTMVAMAQAGQPIDPLTVHGALPAHGVVDVSPAYLASLMDGMPHSANVGAYARQVRELWLRRELRAVGETVAREAQTDGEAGADVLERAEQALFRLGAATSGGEWIDAPTWAGEIYTAVEGLAQGRGAPTGVTTGLPDLDDMTRGLQRGDLVLLGARPSLGKTALALQVALHAALAVPVAFVSVEMSRQPLGLRAVAGEARIDSWRMRQGYLRELEHRAIGEAIAAIGERRFYVDESPLVSPVHLRSRLRRLRARVGPLGLVVIDYLQLMAPLPEHRRETKTNQVAGISRALKLMAREFDTPFLVLAQLNREVERTANKMPTMADLRDSGALEQDADVVLLLHRPGAYDRDRPELETVAQLIVAKQRNGPTGTVDLEWRREITRFEPKGPSA